MSGIPFEYIRGAALAQAGRLLQDWFPHGRVTGREFKIGSIRGEPGSSLSVNLDTGIWADFAGTEQGGDLIDLRAAIAHGGNAGDAARELVDVLGLDRKAPRNGTAHHPVRPTIPKRWTSIFPPPVDAGKPPAAVLDGFDVVYEYCDHADRITHYVGRIEARGGRRKVFIPVTFGIKDGVRGWHRKRLDGPLPLYGLNRLSAFPNAPVLLCEGEKAADAAQSLFPDHACLSWCGGTGSVDSADLAPLRGRDVTIWPDADQAGCSAAQKLLSRLPGARVVRVDDLSDGFDAADVNPDDPETWLAERMRAAGGRTVRPPLMFGKLRVHSMEDLGDAAPRGYLVKGLMSPGEMSVWWGPPKCGKSFLLLYVAYAIAQGRSVFGRRVRACPVLYVAAEGEAGLAGRGCAPYATPWGPRRCST